MKKTFLLASILLISVITTACINNFAIQELNNKAKEFMDKGDYISAIERLKSSVDLDDSIFETQYNLAVAYTEAEDYQNAIKTYKKVLEINPDFADAYYSLAVCEENVAKDIISGELIVDDNGDIQKNENINDEDYIKPEKVSDYSQQALGVISSVLEDARSNYNTYSDKSGSSKEVEDKLIELEELGQKYAQVTD